MFTSRLAAAAATAVLVCLAAAGPVDAELRSGTQTDPVDGSAADIESVRAYYDSDTGAAGAVARFVSPLAPPVVSANGRFSVTMHAGGPPPGGASRPDSCEPNTFITDISAGFGLAGPGGYLNPTTAFAQFGPQIGSPDFGSGSGFVTLQQAPATAAWSADGRELTLTTNVGPGRPLRCFTAETATDTLDAPAWFDGLRPAVTGCTDTLDNDHDGTTDRNDPECRHGSTETDPRKVATRANLRVRPIRCGVRGRSRVVETPPSDLEPREGFRFYG